MMIATESDYDRRQREYAQRKHEQWEREYREREKEFLENALAAFRRMNPGSHGLIVTTVYAPGRAPRRHFAKVMQL